MANRRIPIWVCAIGLATLAGCAGAAEAKDGMATISARLVDEQGNPVEGAEVGPDVSCAQSRPDGKTIKETGWTIFGFERAKTGKDGIVRFRTGLRQLSQGPFMHAVAWQADRKLFGIAMPQLRWGNKPGEIVLKPACWVKFHFSCPELEARNRPVKSAVIQARWADEDPFKFTAWMELKKLDGNFEFPALPGAIQLEITTDDTVSRTYKFTLPPGQRELDLGAIDLSATKLALREDQRAPEFHDVVAWVNSQPLDLAKLKGKVVLLDFWGYWCGACVQYSMPELLDLYEQRHDQGLVIIGVHVSRGGTVVESAEKLEPKISEIRAKFWKGRSLPFPVALAVGKQGLVHYLDKEPGIATDYGVQTYPTAILIDRRGKVAAYSVGFPLSEKFRDALKRVLSER
jgi:thiol-disulfide isomerase/thioredoxin